MAQLIVRELDSDIKVALQQRARQHGWSMEEEVRQILRRSVDQTPAVPAKLGSRIAARFKDLGLDEPIPESRGQTVEPLTFPG
jgi:plasmid stability protein